VQKLRILALLVPTTVIGQWTYGASGTSAELRGLSAVNDRVVWASGARGTVVRSTDGGRTWIADSVTGFSALDFRSIHALNDGAAFIASAGEAEKGLARILATGDAGRHWNPSYATDQKGVFLDAIAFWDAKNGIALSDPVGEHFFILVTSDGGGSWARVPPARLPRVLPGEAAFAASGSALVVQGTEDVWIGTGGAWRARVMHSADRGRTWSFTETPVHADGAGGAGGASGIFSLAFFDRLRGVAVGGDYTKPRLPAQSVALTFDGGRSWYRAKSPPAAYLSGVAYAGSAALLTAVGLAGTFVSSDSGQSWAQTDTLALNSVRFSGRFGFAVGPRGRVARTEGIPR
jgi:photosystem II stability/assembly factor-like uncharacterized protein